MSDKNRGPATSASRSSDQPLDLSISRDSLNLGESAVLEASTFDEISPLVREERRKVATGWKVRSNRQPGIPSLESLESTLPTNPEIDPRKTTALGLGQARLGDPELENEANQEPRRSKKHAARNGTPQPKWAYSGTVLDRLMTFVANLIKRLEQLLLPSPQQAPPSQQKRVVRPPRQDLTSVRGPRRERKRIRRF